MIAPGAKLKLHLKFDSARLKSVLKLSVISWALYDFANTSFAIVMITVVFPVFFTGIIANEAMYGKNFGDLMWGASSGISMLIAAACAPVFGAIADTTRSKNRFLIILTTLSIICCFFLYFTGEGTVVKAMLIFIAANFFYQTSMLFYNSFLPELSDKTSVGFVSGFGFALGYVGGLLMLLIIYPLIAKGIIDTNISNIRLTFILTALFFLVFSLPSFIFLKDKKIHSDNNRSGVESAAIQKTDYIKAGFARLSDTLKKIRKNKNLLRFLAAYFLFSNAFSILAVFASVYGMNTLKLSLNEIVILFIIGHIPTIIFSVFFGWLVDRAGAKNVIILTLILWCLVIIFVTVFDSKVVFYIAFSFAAVITGSTLIASRSLMTFLTPYELEAEYFSFYAIGGKFSSILGPVVFGLIAYFTKNEKIALLSTVGFLLAGLFTILTVKVPGQRSKVTPASRTV